MDHEMDRMMNPVAIPLDERTCPVPRNTPYIAIDRNHYVKDDKKLRYIHQSTDDAVTAMNAELYDNDSDTEFEEQEDVLLDFLYEHVALDDESTIHRIERVFCLSFDRIQHRIMTRSHRKSKILKQQKQTLSVHGYDTKNEEVPIDSFSLLFCPRCMTYDCSLHGLDAPRRRNRALPSDGALRENVDYFGSIRSEIRSDIHGEKRRVDPNALAHFDGNLSNSNHLIDSLLPSTYTPSRVYPRNLSDCSPCSSRCYIDSVRSLDDGAVDTANAVEYEWAYMELANLRRLLNICKLNFCQIAAILGQVSCQSVYLKAKELIPNLRPYVRSHAMMMMMDSPKTKTLRKKAPAVDPMERGQAMEAPELGTENIPHQFFGCNHAGPCTPDNGCSCCENKTFCEKFCSCTKECCRRFRGCQCVDGRCRGNECPCFRSHRECDPDQCRQCQSYLPRRVVDAAVEWLKVNAPEYHRKWYRPKFMEKQSASSSSSTSTVTVSSSSEDNGSEEEKKEGHTVDWDGRVRVKILGIDGVDPFKLCGNVGCTQQRNKRLWIGKSRVHGFGCFVAEPIMKDEYITEYLGEMISQNEADRRGTVYDEQNISYLFNLNEEYVIDATRKGGKIKFANHSTNPNCRAKIVTVNGDHRIWCVLCPAIDNMLDFEVFVSFSFCFTQLLCEQGFPGRTGAAL